MQFQLEFRFGTKFRQNIWSLQFLETWKLPIEDDQLNGDWKDSIIYNFILTRNSPDKHLNWNCPLHSFEGNTPCVFLRLFIHWSPSWHTPASQWPFTTYRSIEPGDHQAKVQFKYPKVLMTFYAKQQQRWEQYYATGWMLILTKSTQTKHIIILQCKTLLK